MVRKFSGIFPQLSKNMMLQLPPLMKVTTKIILILQIDRTNILVLYFSGRNLKGKEICIKNLSSRIRQPLSASSSPIDKAVAKKQLSNVVMLICHPRFSKTHEIWLHCGIKNDKGRIKHRSTPKKHTKSNKF